ncbi:TPA: hypothetical protein NJY08_005109 [Salmonella enterica subsp. enterica serovar Typhi str. AG3]|nr:hypothetical protein [Salmonella enterica subsp. enterica serovar Typhi str. AG3]
MENIHNTLLRVWRVRVGDEYYTGCQLNQSTQTLKFSCIKNAAWLFAIESVADSIAKLCNGVKECAEITEKEWFELREFYHECVNSRSSISSKIIVPKTFCLKL